MEVSNFSYKGDAIDGTGGENKESLKLRLFKWIQANPDKCAHTTIKALAHRAASDIGEGRADTFIAYLVREKAKGTISTSGSKYGKVVRINYFHPEVSKELLETASEEDKKYIREVYERAEKMGGVVGSEGEITTQSPAEQASPEKTPSVEVKQTRQGQQITFTININL